MGRNSIFDPFWLLYSQRKLKFFKNEIQYLPHFFLPTPKWYADTWIIYLGHTCTLNFSEIYSVKWVALKVLYAHYFYKFCKCAPLNKVFGASLCIINWLIRISYAFLCTQKNWIIWDLIVQRYLLIMVKLVLKSIIYTLHNNTFIEIIIQPWYNQLHNLSNNFFIFVK